MCCIKNYLKQQLTIKIANILFLSLDPNLSITFSFLLANKTKLIFSNEIFLRILIMSAYNADAVIKGISIVPNFYIFGQTMQSSKTNVHRMGKMIFWRRKIFLF
jgi:hypothetical protein